LCGTEVNIDSKIPIKWKVSFSFWFLLFYLVIVSFCIVFFGFYLDVGSVIIWSKVASFALLEYLFVLEGCFTFVVYVFSPAYILTDIQRMFKRLRNVGKMIMARRTVGATQKERCDTLQHFNAACRVARIRPKYLTSRLLIQLNDLDIPATYASRPAYSSRICACQMGLFLALAKLPPLLSDLVVYLFFVTFFGILCAVGHYLYVFNVFLAIIVVAFLIFVMILVYYIYFIGEESRADRDAARQSPGVVRRVLDRIFPCKRRRRRYQVWDVEEPPPPAAAAAAGDGDALSAGVSSPPGGEGTGGSEPHQTPSTPVHTEEELRHLKDELNEFQKQLVSLKKQNSSLK
jgi:hypothetical protein